MKKYLFLGIISLLTCLNCNAQQKVIMKLYDGTTIEREVWEVESITFADLPQLSANAITDDQAVDLGLSVKWAPFNLCKVEDGEEVPLLVGWGDVSGTNQSTDLKFFPVLNPDSYIMGTQYDIAHTLWGSEWRLPSDDDMRELMTMCEWTQRKDEAGVLLGFDVKGSTGNSIFLPVTGSRRGTAESVDGSLGFYWTGMRATDPTKAFALNFSADNKQLIESERYMGYAIRPVYGPYLIDIETTVSPASNVTKNSAYVTVKFTGSADHAELLGLRLATNSNELSYVEPLTCMAAQLDEEGAYTFHLTSLAEGTTYYYQSVAVLRGRVSVSEIRSFATAAKYTVQSVDLGLPSGLLWSAYNLGAESPSQIGKYFAWADPYEVSTCQADYPRLVEGSPMDIAGTEFDVVTHVVGNGWHMPNDYDFMELQKYCNWTYQAYPTGWIVSSKSNGNSIFLPYTGNRQGDGTMYHTNPYTEGFYWTSKNSSFLEAVYFTFGSSAKTSGRAATTNKYLGMAIRPVHGMSNRQEPKDDTGEQSSPYDNAAVNMGLSVHWAKYNLGATKPSQLGDPYAWGETSSNKTQFTADNYVWCSGGSYTYPGTDDIAGSAYDAAHEKWGGDWKMPSELEFMELFEMCDWTWTYEEQVPGYKVTSKVNGNHIFLPATEDFIYGEYWSSTLYSVNDRFYNTFAYYLSFSESRVPTYLTSYYRYLGKHIRPVKKNYNY